MIDLMEFDFPYKKLKPASIIGKPVTDAHYKTTIENSSYVYLEKHKPIVYINSQDTRFNELIPYLNKLNFADSTRKTLGRSNKSILFGAVTAAINRDSNCNIGATASKSPDLNKLLNLKYSTLADELMAKVLPQYHKIGHNIFKHIGILDDWRMANTFWTSGIINKNSPHNFHLDSQNCRNSYSVMITMKNNMSGGYLVIPEYDIAFKVGNGSLIYFCGKELIHGVSPITLGKEGYRYSIVYYTTEDMKFCESYDKEIKK